MLDAGAEAGLTFCGGHVGMFGGSVDIAMPNFGWIEVGAVDIVGGLVPRFSGFLFAVVFLLFLFYLYVLLFLNCRVENIRYYNLLKTSFVNTRRISLPIQTTA
jgi:hypothetical protein